MGALALVTKQGQSPAGSAAAKVDALVRVGATVDIRAWPLADIIPVEVWQAPKGQKAGTWGQITTGGGQAAV